jgi:hypothetical protein
VLGLVGAAAVGRNAKGLNWPGGKTSPAVGFVASALL